MKITSQMVKELRDKTNAGMMDCKKALGETDGDMEKAIVQLCFGRDPHAAAVILAVGYHDVPAEDTFVKALIHFETNSLLIVDQQRDQSRPYE